VTACVFDAYGTLFDVDSVARTARHELGHRWLPLSHLWRSKQLQYTWLRSLSGHPANFWQVTGDALDHALAAVGITDTGLREELMTGYLGISAYPEVPAMLEELRSTGMRLAILSNGTPHMLSSALRHSATEGFFEAVLSAEEAGVFKPHPDVYRLAPRRLGVAAQTICFISSNGWDAWSGKAFGYQVLWCNRTQQAPEHLPTRPDGEISDLGSLPAWLAARR
jgi:2-haloacid dehalogenase